MAEEVTARQELVEYAEKLREADANEKKWKATKEKVRKPFLELVTEVVETEIPLAVIGELLWPADLPGDTLTEKIERYRLATYPEYEITNVEQPTSDAVNVTFREDPAVRKYSFTHNGFKYGRTFSMTGGGIDIEGLYEALATPPGITIEGQGALIDAITPKQVIVYELDEVKFRAALTDHPELVSFVQQFIDPGKPQVKLTPITKAKDEEE